MSSAVQEAPMIDFNFNSLSGAPETNPVPKTAVEKVLDTVSPDDAAASTMADTKFKFRSMLTNQQAADLERNAKPLAMEMVHDLNKVINFGSPILAEMEQTYDSLMKAQEDIKMPEVDALVNNLLRDLDGYQKKYRNVQLETTVNKVMHFLKGAGYSLKTMVRDAKPIIEKMELAKQSLYKAELDLKDTIEHSEVIRDDAIAMNSKVIAVLAALEQVLDILHGEFSELNAALEEAEKIAATSGGISSAVWNGKTCTVQELRDEATEYANSISEIEKTWFDWRQQFFFNYAKLPSTRNLILVSATMMRRCKSLRTMGLTNGKAALVMAQQAVLAKQSAETAEKIDEATNQMIQMAFDETGKSVGVIAKAAQTPMISQETVLAIVDSVQKQCQGLVEADAWGRQVRAQNLSAIESGEASIQNSVESARKELVKNALIGTSESNIPNAPLPEKDILAQLGVK